MIWNFVKNLSNILDIMDGMEFEYKILLCNYTTLIYYEKLTQIIFTSFLENYSYFECIAKHLSLIKLLRVNFSYHMQ